MCLWEMNGGFSLVSTYFPVVTGNLLINLNFLHPVKWKKDLNNLQIRTIEKIKSQKHSTPRTSKIKRNAKQLTNFQHNTCFKNRPI